MHLRLDWSWQVLHSAFMIAREKGYYAEAGLDVTIEQGQGSRTTTILVGDGQSPVGHVNLSTAAQSIAAGVPITAVAAISQQGPIGLICDADTKVMKPDDIKGRAIGSTPSGSDAQILPAFLKRNNLSTSDVRVVSMQGDAKFAALMSEQVDCISGDIPYYAPQAEEKGKKTMSISYAEWGVPNLAYGLIANNDFLKKNPDAVRRFVEASLRGVDYAYSNIGEAVDLFIQKSGSTQSRNYHIGLMEYYKKAFHTPNTEGKPIGWMSEEDWKGMLEALGAPADKPASSYFTNQFIPTR
jgi:NitT/TauT family transport system substrate-binding protein